MNDAARVARKASHMWSLHYSISRDYDLQSEKKQWGAVVEEIAEVVRNGVISDDGEVLPVRLFCLLGDQKELHR